MREQAQVFDYFFVPLPGMGVYQTRGGCDGIFVGHFAA
jgi:hypothetical protein